MTTPPLTGPIMQVAWVSGDLQLELARIGPELRPFFEALRHPPTEESPS